MSKYVKIACLAVLVAGLAGVALSIAPLVLAQGPGGGPDNPDNPPAGDGTPAPFGPMGGGMGGGGRGGHHGGGPGWDGGPMGGWMSQYGEMMHERMAEFLGMTEDELDAAMAEGKTPWQIAEEKGISQDEFAEAMQSIRADILKQAVADGVITQEQADWMLDHEQYGPKGSGPGWDGGPMGDWMSQYSEMMHERMAEFLGMTEDELDAAMAEGKTPWQIAEEKGISQDEFAEAMQSIRADILEQAVADGVITQEQADWMLDHEHNGPKGGGPGWDGGPMGGWMSQYSEMMHERMAEFLGMTEDELEAALTEGKTPWQIAEEKGISQEEFEEAMQTIRADILKQAVADGVITQEQADWMLDHEHNGPKGGGPGWGGGPMGGGPGDCPHANPPAD